jgi:two-component system, LytTR family, response regulator
MNVIRAVIVDDEELARQVVHEMLLPHPEVEVVAECANGFDAVKAVTELNPDLLFLDVQMPKLDGFEVLELIGPDIAVVFLTAYDQYALRAFEVRAIDYLLKPFTADRLHSAVQRVRDQIRSADRQPNHVQLNEQTRNAYNLRIVFKSHGRILFLPVSDIRWIGAEENYVRICTATETHLLRETMASMEQRLDPRSFLRVHRSAIVNLQYVKEVRSEPKGDFVVQLVNGHKVSMSRGYHARIGELLARA